MRITLERVTPRGSRLLDVIVEQPLYKDGGFTAESDRLLRVLYTQGERSSHSIHGKERRISIGYARIPEAFRTLTGLQAEVDRYANVPMELRFGQVELWAYGRNPHAPRTVDDIVRALEDGHQVEASMFMSSASLPFISRDAVRVAEEHGGIAAYGPYTRGSGQPQERLGKIGLCWRYFPGGGSRPDPERDADAVKAIARRVII